jgi:hypothetical protein
MWPDGQAPQSSCSCIIYGMIPAKQVANAAGTTAPTWHATSCGTPHGISVCTDLPGDPVVHPAAGSSSTSPHTLSFCLALARQPSGPGRSKCG